MCRDGVDSGRSSTIPVGSGAGPGVDIFDKNGSRSGFYILMNFSVNIS